MILIVEDVERFPTVILRTLISACASRNGYLPLLLVFGLATNLEAVQARLGSAEMAKLSMQKFSALSSVRLFGEACDVVSF